MTTLSRHAEKMLLAFAHAAQPFKFSTVWPTWTAEDCHAWGALRRLDYVGEARGFGSRSSHATLYKITKAGLAAAQVGRLEDKNV